MIWQGLLDFMRDAVVTWFGGLNSLLSQIGVDTAADAVHGASAGAVHFLALFVGNASWPSVVAAFSAYTVIWLTTGLIAIVSRRGTAS